MKILTIAAVGIALAVGGCSQFKSAGAVFDTITTPVNAGVPADAVMIAANSFDILKRAAVTYAQFCVSNKNTPPACSVSNRRIVVKAVNAGTAARNAAEAAVNSGQTVGSAVYNTLTSAVTALQSSPAPAYIR